VNITIPPIVFNGVSLYFNNRAALDDVTLEFQRGKSTAVIGSSGSGKSLVLKCAAGLIFPDEGIIAYEGTSIASMKETPYQKMQARTGFHFQDAALWANKSLGENLSLPLLSTNPDYTDSELKNKVEESFASVGLQLNPSLRPASISMGQRKLVSFLRATISRPDILFLDDPLGFMDREGSRQLIAKIEEFRDDGATIIMATHDSSLIKTMTDQIMVLTHGRLSASGSYQDVLPLLRELV